MQKLIKQYEDKGMAVLKQCKQEYEKMASRYNDEVLKQESNKLVKKAEEQLASLKHNFIEEACKLQEQLIKQAEAEDSNAYIKDDMTFMRKFNELNLKYEVLPLHLILDAMNDIDSEFEFNIAKRQALKLADKEQQREIYNRFYQNPLYAEVKASKQYVIELKSNNKKFILPFGMNDINSYITGNEMNNYYFSGRVIEDVTSYYFSSNK